jgi:hypothetical protein
VADDPSTEPDVDFPSVEALQRACVAAGAAIGLGTVAALAGHGSDWLAVLAAVLFPRHPEPMGAPMTQPSAQPTDVVQRPMPRLGVGLVWSDIVAEIARDDDAAEIAAPEEES